MHDRSFAVFLIGTMIMNGRFAFPFILTAYGEQGMALGIAVVLNLTGLKIVNPGAAFLHQLTAMTTPVVLLALGIGSERDEYPGVFCAGRARQRICRQCCLLCNPARHPLDPAADHPAELNFRKQTRPVYRLPPLFQENR